MTSMTTGNISAISRPATSDVSVSSSLTTRNRCTSWGSRTKARTTRMPVICSRRTRLTPSSLSCMSRNCGTIRPMMIPRAIASTGMLTPSSQDRPASWRKARMTPPMMVTGAARTNVHTMTTISWTCCTSLVTRVMSDGAPIRLTSRADSATDRWNSTPRTSRPNAIATREPR